MFTGATDGQLTVHWDVEPTTVDVAVAELSSACNSFVLLDMLAKLEMRVPAGAPLFTLKVTVKAALALAGNVASVHEIVPVALPGSGTVQLNTGPESCVLDTKVVF